MTTIVVKTKDNFVRSTNIKVAFNQSQSLENIILSSKFQNRFIDIISSVVDDSSNQRVHIIAGTPGTGKSTFALFLAKSITHSQNSSILLKNNQHLLTEDFIKIYKQVDKISYLPVFLNGNEGDIEDAFYLALRDAFVRQGWLEEFEQLVSHCSAQALSIIATWQKNFPHKIKELKHIIKNNNDDYEKFIDALHKNKRYAQKLFSEIYQNITGGAKIASVRHGQVLELYRNASHLLQQKNHRGIFIIYDEFGKFLERGIRQPNNFDLHFLQDIAELSNNSKEHRMHLLLITHLPPSQYTAQLSITVRREWQKIEGRFQQLSFNNRHESNYTIISAVFVSRKEHPKLLNLARVWQQKNHQTKNLLALCQSPTKIITNCYPLHPLIIGLLPLLSEKVAQNERTMFSFLTRNEEFSLARFLEKTLLNTTKLQFMPLTDLYFYFSPLFDNLEGRRQKIRLVVDGLLNETDITAERDIIILLGLKEIINNRSILKATEQSIASLLLGLHSLAETKQALTNLLNKKMISYNKLKQEFCLPRLTSLDLQEELDKVRPTKLTTASYSQILKKHFPLSFVLPKKYNFLNGMTRYYREQLLSIEDLEKNNFQINYAKEDGQIFYLTPFTERDVQHIKQLLRQRPIPSALFVSANEPLEIIDCLLELQAIDQLYQNKNLFSDDSIAKKELDHHQANIYELANKCLGKIRSNLDMNASAYYLGNCLDKKITSISRLGQLASKICKREYASSPIFYNEMLNRHKPSTPVIQGRGRLISALLAHCSSTTNSEICQFKITGGGPEFAFHKALLKTNFFSDKENGLVLKPNSTLVPLFADFCKLLKSSDQSAIVINDLISRWQTPPFGVRTALIPLYLSIFAKLTPSPLSFFYNNIYVANPDMDLFEGLIRQPKKYSLRMVVINAEKREYLLNMCEKFSTPLPIALQLSIPSLNFANTTRIVSNFYSFVPKYTRNHISLTVGQKKLVTLLDTLCQPEKFFLDDLPKLYCQQSFSELCYSAKLRLLQKLENDLISLFNCYANLIKRLWKISNNALRELLSNYGIDRKIAHGDPLAKYWQELGKSFPESVKNFPFSSTTANFVNRVFQISSEVSNQQIIENIADSLTGANPKHWNKKGEVLFNFNLQRAVAEITEVTYLQMKKDKNLVRISTLNSNHPAVYEIICANFNPKFHQKLLDNFFDSIEHLPDTEKNIVILTLLKRINKKVETTNKITNNSSIGEAWG